jgi:DNA-binding GntR family transcriptional regulator
MAPPKADPTPHQTKSDRARSHIQELILSGTARAGDRLTTREVAEALGISETPIREAIRLLAAEGWLTLSPHHGVVIASINASQITEVYAIRGALGALAIERGAASYTQTQLAALDTNLATSGHAVATADIQAYVRLNREFHALLSDTPHTQWTLRLLDNIWAQTAAAGRGFEAVPDRLKTSLAEHRAIRAAIAEHNYPKAAQLLAEHERIAGAALIAALDSK